MEWIGSSKVIRPAICDRFLRSGVTVTSELQVGTRRWKSPLLTLRTRTLRPHLSTGGTTLDINLEAATALVFLPHHDFDFERIERRESFLQFCIQTWPVPFERT